MKTIALTLKFEFNGNWMKLSPSLIVGNGEVILVDCSNPGTLPILEDALASEGYSLSDITKVVITHHDHDHFGAVSELKRKFPHIVVYASEIETPYLQGEKRSLRLQQAESIYESLPEDRKEWADKFHAYLKGLEPLMVDQMVKGGTFIDDSNEVMVVETPGHMPGHISIYVKGDQTLIAGDALIVQNGELLIANPRYSLDLEMACLSTRKLSELDIRRIICHHGGSFSHEVVEVREALKRISFK